MNCLEFRRVHGAEPGSEDHDYRAHLRDCKACASFASQSLRFERLLKQAFKTEVPENLASRILLRHSFQARRTQLSWRRHAYALAASIVLSVGLVGGFVLHMQRGPSLGEAVVSHVNEELFALTASGPVGEEELQALIKPVGLELTGYIGNVTFATLCVVRGKITGHLVMEGEKAPVTVLLMPNERVKERSVIREDHLRGMIVPQGNGALVIVGAPGEPLDSIASRVQSVVRWQA